MPIYQYINNCVTTTITNLSVDDDKDEDVHLLFVI